MRAVVRRSDRLVVAWEPGTAPDPDCYVVVDIPLQPGALPTGEVYVAAGVEDQPPPAPMPAPPDEAPPLGHAALEARLDALEAAVAGVLTRLEALEVGSRHDR